MHDVADLEQQIAPQLAGGVKAGEVLFAEAARLHQRACESIADCEREGRGVRRDDSKPVGFRAAGCVQNEVGLLRHRGVYIADERDYL